MTHNFSVDIVSLKGPDWFSTGCHSVNIEEFEKFKMATKIADTHL